jgi:hypothetical protein
MNCGGCCLGATRDPLLGATENYPILAQLADERPRPQQNCGSRCTVNSLGSFAMILDTWQVR